MSATDTPSNTEPQTDRHAARDAILARIREALGEPTAEAVRPASIDPPTPEAFAEHLPRVAADHAGKCQRFAELSEKLKTAFHVVHDRQAMLGVLSQLKQEANLERIASHDNALTREACDALGLPVCWTDGGYDPAELERCDAAITSCEALIAQTGSVLISARDTGGRALSVLAPHHIVLATADQLVTDLVAAYQHLRARYGEDLPSAISFITGPSRTGDIERILVLGAHGPKRLTVILVDAPA